MNKDTFIISRRIKINNKIRIIYKKTKSKTEYIKNNGEMILFSEYKKKHKLQKGGGIYDENYTQQTIKDPNTGIEYIKDIDKNNSPLEDPISQEYIPLVRAVLVNQHVYDARPLNNWVRLGNRSDPLTRQQISEEKINEIRRKSSLEPMPIQTQASTVPNVSEEKLNTLYTKIKNWYDANNNYEGAPLAFQNMAWEDSEKARKELYDYLIENRELANRDIFALALHNREYLRNYVLRNFNSYIPQELQ